jgi:hypothetical protein
MGCGGTAPTQGFHPYTPYLIRSKSAISQDIAFLALVKYKFL